MRQFHFTSFPCNCNLVPISPINEILDRKKNKMNKAQPALGGLFTTLSFSTTSFCATNLCKSEPDFSSHYSLHYLYFLTPNIHYRYQEKKTRITISELNQVDVTLCHISTIYMNPFLKTYSPLPAPASYGPLSWRRLDARRCRRSASV